MKTKIFIGNAIKHCYYHTISSAINKIYLSREANRHEDSVVLGHVTHQLTGNSGDTVLSYCVRHSFNTEMDCSWDISGVRDVVTDKTVERYNQTNGIIIGGGGLFLPDSNENSISGWQWPCSKELLSKINVPIIVYSVGYNYFRGQYPSHFFIENLNALLEHASFVGLRNNGSIRCVQSIADKKYKEKISYQPCTTTLIRKFEKNLPPKTRNRNVAINIALDRISSRLGKNYKHKLNCIAQAIKEIEKCGYSIFCVAHCSCDLDFCDYLDANDVSYHIVDGELWFPNQWFKFYNNMEIVFGMRGHAQMIPFGVNTKIITLGSHDKMKWFLEDIDSTDLYVELNEDPDIIREQMIERFHYVESNHTIIRDRFFNKQEELYRITVNNAEVIHDLVK